MFGVFSFRDGDEDSVGVLVMLPRGFFFNGEVEGDDIRRDILSSSPSIAYFGLFAAFGDGPGGGAGTTPPIVRCARAALKPLPPGVV